MRPAATVLCFALAGCAGMFSHREYLPEDGEPNTFATEKVRVIIDRLWTNYGTDFRDYDVFVDVRVENKSEGDLDVDPGEFELFVPITNISTFHVTRSNAEVPGGVRIANLLAPISIPPGRTIAGVLMFPGAADTHETIEAVELRFRDSTLRFPAAE